MIDLKMIEFVLKAGHSGVWCLLVCLFACLLDCLICGCFTMFRMWVGVSFVLLFLNILISQGWAFRCLVFACLFVCLFA